VAFQAVTELPLATYPEFHEQDEIQVEPALGVPDHAPAAEQANVAEPLVGSLESVPASLPLGAVEANAAVQVFPLTVQLKLPAGQFATGIVQVAPALGVAAQVPEAEQANVADPVAGPVLSVPASLPPGAVEVNEAVQAFPPTDQFKLPPGQFGIEQVAPAFGVAAQTPEAEQAKVAVPVAGPVVSLTFLFPPAAV
jgi:hypothetical protein